MSTFYIFLKFAYEVYDKNNYNLWLVYIKRICKETQKTKAMDYCTKITFYSNIEYWNNGSILFGGLFGVDNRSKNKCEQLTLCWLCYDIYVFIYIYISTCFCKQMI